MCVSRCARIDRSSFVLLHLRLIHRRRDPAGVVVFQKFGKPCLGFWNTPFPECEVPQFLLCSIQEVRQRTVVTWAGVGAAAERDGHRGI